MSKEVRSRHHKLFVVNLAVLWAVKRQVKKVKKVKCTVSGKDDGVSVGGQSPGRKALVT